MSSLAWILFLVVEFECFNCLTWWVLFALLGDIASALRGYFEFFGIYCVSKILKFSKGPHGIFRGDTAFRLPLWPL